MEIDPGARKSLGSGGVAVCSSFTTRGTLPRDERHASATRVRYSDGMRAFIVFALVGCGSGSAVSDSDLDLTYAGNYDGSLLHVVVSFQHASGDSFLVDSHVGLSVSIRGAATDLEDVAPNLTSSSEFVADIPIAGAAGEDATLAVDRDGQVTHSTFTIPADFTLDAVPASMSRAGSFTATWQPVSPDPMWWLASGDCLAGTNIMPGPDAGSFVIPALQGAGSCMATLQVSRNRDSSVDPAYHGGIARGLQSRYATFMSTP